MKLDAAAAWFKGPTVYLLGAFLVWATITYMRMNASIEKMDASINRMHNDLQMIVSERQFNAWLALFQALNKDLKAPELPK